MDLFQHRYYRLGKNLMFLSGQWPYHSLRTRIGIAAFIILFCSYLDVTFIQAIAKYRNDWNILMECFVSDIFGAIGFSKFFSATCNSRNILKLLDRIRMDWKVWARHQEVRILHEYAERGEKITIVYTAMIYCIVLLFMIQPMITKLIDIVIMNGTKPGKFPYPIIYDPRIAQKYYFYLNIYATVCACMTVTVFISGEVMLILYTQHVCGIFAAVGRQLERIGSNDKSVKTSRTRYVLEKTEIVYLVSCIDRHNDAIEFADLIKSSYAWNFFVSTIFGSILVNITGLQMLLRTDDLGAVLTFMGGSLGSLFVFYIECHISQTLIDHSISIHYYIHNSQWYRLPPKTQKILQFMVMRSNLPCQLTVGNMLIMSMRSFALVLRTLMSFFTCMRTMQGI